MTDFTLSNTGTDLKYDLDEKEIWNDFRGVIPNGYKELIGATWYVHYDTKKRYLDSDSALKYGNRVKLIKYYAKEEWVDALAEFASHKYDEPFPEIKLFVAGEDDTLIANIFNMQIPDRVNLINTTMGMNKWFWINKYILHADMKHYNMPILELKLEEIRSEYLTGWFMIDTDSIDGSKLIA